ncbi:MAG: DUF4350 domain-containing protein [Propionibacteriales bacterium]|nr:DUF4350 domain-containing protein [Propionibacteriales bacterium]
MTQTQPMAERERTDRLSVVAADQPSEVQHDSGPPEQPRRRGRRWVVPLILGGLASLLLIVLLATALVNRDRATFTTDEHGYAAIRALLEDEGVTVTSTTQLSATVNQIGPDTTVAILPGQYTEDQLRRLLDAGPGRIVMINPNFVYLSSQSVPVGTSKTGAGVYQPTCADPAAVRAGAVELPHTATTTIAPTATLSCYGGAEGSLYSVVPVAGVPVHIFNVPFTNDVLAREGNAALAMQVLGQHERLVWYEQSDEGPSIAERGIDADPSLVGPNWLHAVALALLALVLCAIWRGRRLGPIITERLPVVIPASETVEGHGRLYARLGVREHAARQLRTAARRRLARRLGHLDDPEALAQSLADRTGYPYAHIRQWLDGPAPVTDDELVMLKRQLDALEQEARQP